MHHSKRKSYNLSLLNLFENNKLYPLNHGHKESHRKKYNNQNKKCQTFFSFLLNEVSTRPA